MSISSQMARHLRDVHFGGNWTTSNLRDTLRDVSWQQAMTQVNGFNSIATLTYHTTYYVGVLVVVLQGGKLEAKDEYSFRLPPIRSQADWEHLQTEAWANAEKAAELLEGMADHKLLENFTDAKYGSYYRNVSGIIEHMHYHLGQITLIKKLLLLKGKN